MQRAPTENHFAPCPRLPVLTLLRVGHANGDSALQQQALGKGTGFNPQIGAFSDCGAQERPGGGFAPSAALAHLCETNTDLTGAIGVVIERQAIGRNCLDKAVYQWRFIADPLDMPFTDLAMVRTRLALIVFATQEIRQHVGVTPALVASAAQ